MPVAGGRRPERRAQGPDAPLGLRNRDDPNCSTSSAPGAPSKTALRNADPAVGHGAPDDGHFMHQFVV
jgi:hypothetical protein